MQTTTTYKPKPLTNDLIKAYAMAPKDQGGLGLDAAAADQFVTMWPQRICLAWKADFIRKVWGWQKRAGRVEVEVE